jgi:hypothetical protein
MMKSILQLDPARYQRHAIHAGQRDWAETNCYADVWIELLHAWGFEPIAALPFTFAIDFEGDQWTFFKFPHADLFQLFGLDVQELALWRPLTAHLEEQVALGRPVLVELDAFFLPDTEGTSYRREHVKSTVAVMEIDADRAHLGYFHNQGYYHLGGDDYIKVLRVSHELAAQARVPHELAAQARVPHDLAAQARESLACTTSSAHAGESDVAILPPYVEFVKRRPGSALKADDLVKTSLRLLGRHLSRLPESNPFVRFKTRMQADLAWLMGQDLSTFHQYSFATLRQFGACFELAATYLRWLQQHGRDRLERCISTFAELSSGAKAMQFQLARSMARKKPLDLSAVDHMAERWNAGVKELRTLFL